MKHDVDCRLILQYRSASLVVLLFAVRRPPHRLLLLLLLLGPPVPRPPDVAALQALLFPHRRVEGAVVRHVVDVPGHAGGGGRLVVVVGLLRQHEVGEHLLARLGIRVLVQLDQRLVLVLRQPYRCDLERE